MKILIVLILVIIASPAIGSDPYCFCSPPVYYPPVEEVVQKLDVVNRHLKLYPTKAPEHDAFSDYAVQRVLKDVMDTMPISPRKEPLRKFEFTRNWPRVAPAKQVERRQIQTQVVTQILYGQVQQNVVVQGGVVSLDVPVDLVTPPEQ
jgi:hypothetical protein